MPRKKGGKSTSLNQLVVLFKKVWEDENIPEDWSKGVIIIVGKLERMVTPFIVLITEVFHQDLQPRS